MIAYPVHLTMDDDGSFLVSSADFPELTTLGRNRREALERAAAALSEVLAARIADNRPVPPPSNGKDRNRVELSTLIGLKIALYCAMIDSEMKRSDLARRLK